MQPPAGPPAPDAGLSHLSWHLGPQADSGAPQGSGSAAPRAAGASGAASASGPAGAPDRAVASGTPGASSSGGFPEPPDSPGTRHLKGLSETEARTGKALSVWNGYKLMSMDVTDAAVHCDRTFPSNVHGLTGENPHERCQIFHDMGGAGKEPGQMYLTPGPLCVGSDDTSELPRDIGQPTARVSAHSHPYTGRHVHEAPSMSDQLIAREFPHVEHIVQTPAPSRTSINPYITYNGALPPRYYTLVDNPFNLPVPPHSPDGDRLPPFHPHPGSVPKRT